MAEASSGRKTFIVRECVRESCRLRLPIVEGEERGDRCPRCGGPTRVAAHGQLRRDSPMGWQAAPTFRLSALVDNVRSTFNVGSILRIADGAGVALAILCGITPTPDNRKVAKTALGAQESVPWAYYANALDAAHELRKQGVSLWALENEGDSRSLFSGRPMPENGGVALVVGNELCGIDPELLALCDDVVHIPMDGAKGSLNVAVAFGIAAYWLRANGRSQPGVA